VAALKPLDHHLNFIKGELVAVHLYRVYWCSLNIMYSCYHVKLSMLSTVTNMPCNYSFMFWEILMCHHCKWIRLSMLSMSFGLCFVQVKWVLSTLSIVLYKQRSPQNDNTVIIWVMLFCGPCLLLSMHAVELKL